MTCGILRLEYTRGKTRTTLRLSYSAKSPSIGTQGFLVHLSTKTNNSIGSMQTRANACTPARARGRAAARRARAAPRGAHGRRTVRDRECFWRIGTGGHGSGTPLNSGSGQRHNRSSRDTSLVHSMVRHRGPASRRHGPEPCHHAADQLGINNRTAWYWPERSCCSGQSSKD